MFLKLRFSFFYYVRIMVRSIIPWKSEFPSSRPAALPQMPSPSFWSEIQTTPSLQFNMAALFYSMQ